MAEFNVAKAIRSNSVYARHLGWIQRYAKVLVVLGFSRPPVTAPAFASAVASWQTTKRLKPDGMLGPKSWQKIKKQLPANAPPAPIPVWLTERPDDEGWFDAAILTLHQDTSILTLRYKTHHVKPADFRHIAKLLEQGDIGFNVADQVGGFYQFDNDADDSNTLNLPRRSRFGWRISQALIVHEACHAISDIRAKPMKRIDEEAFAYVIQGMFRVHFKVQSPKRSAETMRLRSAARTIARQQLSGNKAPESDWDRLRSSIRTHSVYREAMRRSPNIEFDGI